MLSTTLRIKHITLTALTAAALMSASCVLAEDMQQPASPAAPQTQPAQEMQSTQPAATESLPTAENPAVTPATEPAATPATAPATTPTATDTMAKPPTTKAATTGTVSRATFTTNVVNHEPVDKIDTVSQSQSMGKVYYFTELKGMKGAQVSHRWEYNGKVMAQVDFTVGSPRWRVYSIKTIKPDQTGTWTVSVVDSNGNVLKTDSINVTK